MEIETWLGGLGLKPALPFILRAAEMAVIWIYKEYFMAKFKQLHLDGYLEQLFKKDLDNDGFINKTPLAAPAFVEPAPVTAIAPEPPATEVPAEIPVETVKLPDKGPVAEVEREVKKTLRTLKTKLTK
jgi:hypothetical protein